MGRTKNSKTITGHFLALGLMILIPGCFFVPEGNGDDPAFESCPAEHLFRHLMAQSHLVRSGQKVCLAFGNPLRSPSAPVLNRFRDLYDRLVGLRQVHGNGFRKGLHEEKSGLPVILYHISRVSRLSRDCWLMEGGWFGSLKQSRKCLYYVNLKGSKCHIQEIRAIERCRHVIACYDTPEGPRFLLKRVAF